MKTIAVDFDGVVHKYSQGWQDGSIYDGPIDGAIEGLKELMKKYAVFIHTSRDYLQVATWLDSYGFNVTTYDREKHGDFWDKKDVLLVSNVKLPAVAYIDDRAHAFYDWKEVLDRFI